ncbi:MAG: hypothetical protein PHH28_17130, partial [Desulfuromonadaceae bacterium]|nr:hypothetical protein [Desulfuromonadaceae bacterium]
TPVIEHPEEENLPVTTSAKRERTAMQKSATSRAEMTDEQQQAKTSLPTTSKKSAAAKASPEIKPIKIAQATVEAACPYCHHKQDLPIEKGKNGKPFFVTCARCSAEFAVRFVPVTMYQAQVAAFK